MTHANGATSSGHVFEIAVSEERHVATFEQLRKHSVLKTESAMADARQGQDSFHLEL